MIYALDGSGTIHPDLIQTLLLIMIKGLSNIYLLSYNSAVVERRSILNGCIMGVIGKEKHFAILAAKVYQGKIRSLIVASSSFAHLGSFIALAFRDFYNSLSSVGYTVFRVR